MQSYKKTLILITVLFAGCQKSLFPGGPRYMREPGGGSRVATDTAKATTDSTTLYITALCGDDAVLFADGMELVRAPADPDPERHRARQGHLWTDRIQGKETVIYRDGEEWLRFPGEELLEGFLLDGGKLHTLGQRPGNQGFCYRIDGREVFSSTVGRIVGSASSREWDAGAFSPDSIGIFYTYAIPFVHSDGTTWEYRIMKGADTFRVIPDDVSGTILDLRVYRGKVYMAALRGRRLCLVCENSTLWHRRLENTETLPEVGLIPFLGEIGLKGVSSFSRYNYSEAWIQLGGRMLRYRVSQRIFTPSVLAKGNVHAFWTHIDTRLINLVLNGRRLPLDYGKYSLMNPLCINAFNDTFVAILSDTSSTEHLVITDSLTTHLRFPGTPTSIRIE